MTTFVRALKSKTVSVFSRNFIIGLPEMLPKTGTVTKLQSHRHRKKLASYEGRSFAYAGPSNWNSLPAYLRDSSLSLSSFKHYLKTFLFSFY